MYTITAGYKGSKYAIRLGADPEFFLGLSVDGKVQVTPVEMFKMLGMSHTPDPKHPQFYNDGKGSIVHQDGVAVEISIPAVYNFIELLDSIHLMQEKIWELFSVYPEYVDAVYAIPSVNYDYVRWNAMGRRMLASNIFGCDPDYNAFNRGAAADIIDASTFPKRFGGGHKHYSGHPLFEEDPILSIKSFAVTVGLACSAFSPVPELEAERTLLYGKAGKFRPQNYPNGQVGVEYRTPSNTWTAPKNRDLALKIFEYEKLAICGLMSNPENAQKLVDEIEVPTQDAILSCNQALCLELLSYVESKI